MTKFDPLLTVEAKIEANHASGNGRPVSFDTLLLLSIARDTREALELARLNQANFDATLEEMKHGDRITGPDETIVIPD